MIGLCFHAASHRASTMTDSMHRRYHVQTFGCQMNVHDSERMKGLLESLGMGEAVDPAEADLLVFNTCTIREKADDRFVAHLMEARAASCCTCSRLARWIPKCRKDGRRGASSAGPRASEKPSAL